MKNINVKIHDSLVQYRNSIKNRKLDDSYYKSGMTLNTNICNFVDDVKEELKHSPTTETQQQLDIECQMWYAYYISPEYWNYSIGLDEV